MCGIFCVIGDCKKEEKYRRATKLMSHRGPDNTGFYRNKDIFIGHNRLSIIDLNDRSNQPFYDNNLVIAYNGEVYNYKELILEHGLKVKTESDTEVVLLMYQKYGPWCLKYFNGMFSFIIYNEDSRDIFVARDRLGIKPLYYYRSSDLWIFSSEISSILEIKESEYDEFGIRQYKKLRMTMKGYTIYKDIKTFPPAHYLENGRMSRYWDLEMKRKDPPNDGELEWLIEDSIKIRKRSDVPVGSYLSGGLDSTILTYILRPKNTWTVGFNELNEFEWSDLANEGIESKHHKTIVDKESFIKTAKWMIKKRREPLSVPNEVLIYLMTMNVRRENTVVLSGEGADELFWGYDRIFKWANEREQLNLNEFDERYCYGTHSDDEVIHYALEGIEGETVIDRIAYFFQVFHLQGLLRRLDNSTMLCSVEARVPFVDHRIVELLAGTPYSWRMGDSFKEPLKRIFSDLIPSYIINRPKVGFPVPLEIIFSSDYPAYVKSPMDSWLMFNLKQISTKLIEK